MVESEKIELDFAQYARAQAHVLSLQPSNPVDAVFLHARALGDGDHVIALAADILNNRGASAVAINGFDGRRFDGTTPGEASEGAVYYHQKLIDNGVSDSSIFHTDEALNTRAENHVFLRLALTSGWKTAIIVAWPHQLLRACLGMVAAMRQSQRWLNVYTAYPRHVDWGAFVSGSQSANPQRRSVELGAEMERISLYQKKGDLASFDKLFVDLQP